MRFELTTFRCANDCASACSLPPMCSAPVTANRRELFNCLATGAKEGFEKLRYNSHLGCRVLCHAAQRHEKGHSRFN